MKKKKCCLYVLKNASVWSSDHEPKKMDLLIKEGRILQMKSEIANVGTVIDLGGKALLPSGVDVQAHLRRGPRGVARGCLGWSLAALVQPLPVTGSRFFKAPTVAVLGAAFASIAAQTHIALTN